MKISVIVPDSQDPLYHDRIYQYLLKITPKHVLTEIILISEYHHSQLISLDKRKSSQFFVKKGMNPSQRLEAGAFHAKGDILYFLSEGYFPPKDFIKRIEMAVQKKLEVGTHAPIWIYRLCQLMPFIILERILVTIIPVKNLMVSSKIYKVLKGFRFDAKNRKLQELLIKSFQIQYSAKII